MDASSLQRVSEFQWEVPKTGRMRVPGMIFASEGLLQDMDENVGRQVAAVASLPGIQIASFAMPDAHWGYGFPIGGVAAFDPDEGGVVSAGGVGFDISCGVRCLLTDLDEKSIDAKSAGKLADAIFHTIPAGVGSTGKVRMNPAEMDAMLRRGAHWAVKRGFGDEADLERIEGGGGMKDADPDRVSDHARERQREEMGTLGSGNHYAEVQAVDRIFDPAAAAALGLAPGRVLVSLHCGSRGLGHQVATEYSRRLLLAARAHGLELEDRELACAPVRSDEGGAYLGAMRAAINCALANRQILAHLAREAFRKVFGPAAIPTLYDVSHNTCQVEEHAVGGAVRTLHVHRKGATRALGPGHPSLPPALRATGQPVLIGGTMGTRSFILTGTREGEVLSLSSACHGAGRAMSRTAALKRWQGRQLVDELARGGVIVRTNSLRGLAEEAPGAYKDVEAVVEITHRAGLANKVARLRPLICIKG